MSLLAQKHLCPPLWPRTPCLTPLTLDVKKMDPTILGPAFLNDFRSASRSSAPRCKLASTNANRGGVSRVPGSGGAYRTICGCGGIHHCSIMSKKSKGGFPGNKSILFYFIFFELPNFSTTYIEIFRGVSRLTGRHNSMTSFF